MQKIRFVQFIEKDYKWLNISKVFCKVSFWKFLVERWTTVDKSVDRN